MKSFQMKPIGTQTIRLKTTVDAADAHTLLHNRGNVFCVAGLTFARQDDGAFDCVITLEPDNGIVQVLEDS